MCTNIKNVSLETRGNMFIIRCHWSKKNCFIQWSPLITTSGNMADWKVLSCKKHTVPACTCLMQYRGCIAYINLLLTSVLHQQSTLGSVRVDIYPCWDESSCYQGPAGREIGYRLKFSPRVRLLNMCTLEGPLSSTAWTGIVSEMLSCW